jgi:MFS transporter, FSR family, fosmidomycin resistance protein
VVPKVAWKAAVKALVVGVAGTLLGGRMADRIGLVRALQLGTVTMVPALVALRLCPDAGIALAAAAAAGLAVSIPFSVMIKLGQDYLPSRPGTATGITLGLAVSIGGLFAPVLGAIAEARGIAAVFTVLCFAPALALILGALLPDPAAREASTVTDENTAPDENTVTDENMEDARSRRALAGRRGTPRSLLPGRSRGR